MNTIFHTIIPGKFIVGGDNTNNDGSGGECSYLMNMAHHNKNVFDDDPDGLILNHDERGLLSMANYGPNKNGGLLYTLEPADK